MKVTVLRAFLLKGERVEPGKVLDLADPLAKELMGMGKVEAAASAKPKPAGPMTTKTAGAIVDGAKTEA
ncbi:MAG: hypothetical protein IPM99_18785 [Rubrivivax sp.]|nr:hypothetical protein [Rubrivivax sp.]